MVRTFFAVILAVMIAMVSGQAVQADYVAEGLELYLNAADTDGAGTAAPDATGALWKDLSGETVHDGALTLANWELSGVGDGTAQDPYAMRFDGEDDHVILDPVFSLDEFNVTVEFWVKVSSAIDEGERPARSYIYSEGSSVSSRHKNSVYFTREDTVWAPQSVQYDQYTPGGTQVTKDYFYTPDEWMQVVVTKSGSDAVLYKNGVVDETFSDVEEYTGGDIAYTTVGAEINDYGERHFFVGDLGIVRLYNAALTTSEVAGNYNNDCETFGLTQISEQIPGDANRDGKVTDADAAILATNWQQSGVGWDQGDFNGDTMVTDADAAILATHWQEGAEAAAPVPEPAMIVLLLAGALAALRVWRRP